MPAQLYPEIEAAARRAEELRAVDRELRFVMHDACDRVVVEVRDLVGRVIRTVSPSEALEIASGAPPLCPPPPAARPASSSP